MTRTGLAPTVPGRVRPERVLRSGRTPWATVAVCAATLAGFAAEAAGLPLAGALEWSREELGRAELWRILGGHLVHWSPGHLAWDLGAFALLAATLERLGRGRLVALCAGSALAISLALPWLEPDMAKYRGLSGIDSALYAAACVHFLAAGRRAGDRVTVALAALLGLGFAAKIGFELATGSALFASLPGAVAPVPRAHMVGAAVGIALSLVAGSRRGRFDSSS